MSTACIVGLSLRGFLRHFGELDRGRLFLELGFGSLFDYRTVVAEARPKPAVTDSVRGLPAPRLEVSASAPTATPEEAAEASIEAAGSEYSDVGIRHRLERNGARNAGFLARVSARALKVP